MSTNASTSATQGTTEAPEIRTYTPQEERRWNRLSTAMSQFHEYFKYEFNTVYELADGSFNKRGMSLSAYLEMARGLGSHLNTHHTIEEVHVFPLLGKRMPAFAMHKHSAGNTGENADEDGVHLKSHQAIHKDELTALIKKYKSTPSSYSPTEMRTCLDGFRDVLFEHLDQEVADLGSENMKKYWTLEEVDRFQM